MVTEQELARLAEFETSDAFYSSDAMRKFARTGALPGLPEGRTASEKRGRLFFDDIPLGPSGKAGTCAHCHGGPMMNQTNRFFPFGQGMRFQSVGVSEFNTAGNPVRKFVFTNPDGTRTVAESSDPGRALVSGNATSPFFDHLNAFKIPSLRGVRKTAPYFHDNSAKSLEEVVAHYARYFAMLPVPIILTPQDQEDIVAYMKLLD
jgi:cytochrome c peroxidase